jgi:hypothetical protein
MLHLVFSSTNLRGNDLHSFSEGSTATEVWRLWIGFASALFLPEGGPIIAQRFIGG